MIATCLARRALPLAILVAAVAAPLASATAQNLHIHTNQDLVQDWRSKAEVAIDDPLSVFDAVLAGLGPEVKVYPTENYFYFWFFHKGQKYAGNIRIDASDRDDGVVHFAYFVDYTDWGSDTETLYRKLGPDDGVILEKVENLVYRVKYKDRSVVFRLNDLSAVKPPPNFLREDEVYIGPIFDESAIQFYLVYNKRLKIFHYFLNEREPVPERFRAARGSSRILIGSRTGFAFFRDRYRDRKILIGVHETNTAVNNYFDGPFDQLPDNFIQGEVLRNALVEVEPSLAGKIDRWGNQDGGAERYLIGPYLQYQFDEDLAIFDDCAKDKSVAPAMYYACFVAERLRQNEPAPDAPAEAPDAPAATPSPGAPAPATPSPAAPSATTPSPSH